MFWKKKTAATEPSKPEAKKLPGPKEIPELVGRHLVAQMKKDPDWVWKLKGVIRPRPESEKAFDFRVFDQAQVAAKNLKIQDFNSLDEHPELILYQGWFDTETRKVEVK